MEKKAYRGRKDVEHDGKRAICTWYVEKFSSTKEAEQRGFRELAEEKQAGVQCHWQLEPPSREHLEQVKCCHDSGVQRTMVKKGFTA